MLIRQRFHVIARKVIWLVTISHQTNFLKAKWNFKRKISNNKVQTLTQVIGQKYIKLIKTFCKLIEHFIN